MGQVIKFPIPPIRLVSSNATAWDRAADALKRRDFREFDRILGKDRTPVLPDGDAA